MEGDYLVPDKQVMREFSVSAMTIYRWTHNPDMAFPPPYSYQQSQLSVETTNQIFLKSDFSPRRFRRNPLIRASLPCTRLAARAV